MNPTFNPKDDLLAHYARKPAQRFLQLDGFTGCQGDTVIAGDALHGDAVMIGVTHELMSTPGRHLPVRVLIHEDAQREDVRRLLPGCSTALTAASRSSTSRPNGSCSRAPASRRPS